MKKYIECKQNDSSELNRWYEHCRDAGIPYVYVCPRSVYASVHWDHMPLDPDQDFQLMANSNGIMSDLLEIFQRYADRKSRYEISELVGKMDNLSLENSRIVANKIFDVLNARLEPVI